MSIGFEQEVEEAENDVSGLTLSFLTIQSVRFFIFGQIPNVEGEDEGIFQHRYNALQFYAMYMSAGHFAAPIRRS